MSHETRLIQVSCALSPALHARVKVAMKKKKMARRALIRRALAFYLDACDLLEQGSKPIVDDLNGPVWNSNSCNDVTVIE